jgi:hypothetical protein
VAKLCEPSSELHIAEDWYRRTALCDLLRLGDEEVTKDRLYRAPLIICWRTRPPSIAFVEALRRTSQLKKDRTLRHRL